ncbi:MAG: 23S rRNA (guanosine(2251)-2'-O)-methyltransferase RlmB [Anaerorhabdus sp.]
MAEIIYGKNSIKDILNSNKIQKLYLSKNHQDFYKKAKQLKIAVEIVDNKFLDKMVNNANHQGMVAKVDDYKLSSVEEILSGIPDNELGFIVILDEISDPHNFGAIIRSALGAGVHGIIIKKHNSCKLNGTVAKVSAGAIEHMPVSEVTNISSTIKLLKERGYWIYGADAHKSSDYRLPKYDTPIVLVIGSEGKGITRLVKEHCDVFVHLPMGKNLESLNASVASGILMYEIYSKRNPI